MSRDPSTHWSLVQKAATGAVTERERFAAVYADPVRAFLYARWRGSPLLSRVDDAVQDVFVDCFREGGALERADSTRAGGFRAFFYGIARVVALRHERTAGREDRRGPGGRLAAIEDVADADAGISTAFDRAWALAQLREAAALQKDRAARSDDGAMRRVELLRLRFEDDLPIRDIAARWGVDAARLHHEYARARQEFKSALIDVVAEHSPGSSEEVEAECRRLLRALG